MTVVALAAIYGMAWVQLEDYGPGTAMNLLRSSGRRGLLFGRDSMESDFAAGIRTAAQEGGPLSPWEELPDPIET